MPEKSCPCLTGSKTIAPHDTNLFPWVGKAGQFTWLACLSPNLPESTGCRMGGWFLLSSFNSWCYKSRLTAVGEASAFAPSPLPWASCLLWEARFVLLKELSQIERSSHALCPGHPWPVLAPMWAAFYSAQLGDWKQTWVGDPPTCTTEWIRALSTFWAGRGGLARGTAWGEHPGSLGHQACLGTFWWASLG